MQALILAGGKGERLKPLTNTTPKSILPVGNIPLLHRQILYLKKTGVREIVVSLGHHSAEIENTLKSGSLYGVSLKCVAEPTSMGTAGAYKYAEKYLKSTTVVLNGDIFTDIDLSKVYEKHKKNRSKATIVLKRIENPADYGLVQIDENYKVLKFLEKPNQDKINQLNINTINAGIYILEPEILKFIPSRETYSFEYQLFPKLLDQNAKFYAFVSEDDDYWLDIGTPERYLQAHLDLLKGKIKNIQRSRNPAEVKTGGELDNFSMAADGCVVSSGSKVINSVLGHNVKIGENAIVQNSVIWSGTKINSGAKILNSIIANDCRIGKNVSLPEQTVLAADTLIKDFN